MENIPSQLPTLLVMISLTSFLLASGLSVYSFKPSVFQQKLQWAALGFMSLGTITVTYCSVGVSKPIYLFSCAIGWGTLLSSFFGHLHFVTAFTAPIISLSLFSNIFFGIDRAPSQSNLSLYGDMNVHIISAVLGQALTVLACGQCLLVLWLDRKLKSRSLADVPAKFPALSSLTRSFWTTLWLGFIFITISLLSGAWSVLNGGLVLSGPLYLKIIWALFIWLWYLIVLVLYHILNYRMQKIARLSLAGFIVIGICWVLLWYSAPWGAS